MCVAVCKTTAACCYSANTCDCPCASFLINPDLSGVAGVPNKYWKIVGAAVQEMNAGEKAAVDAALAADGRDDK